MSDPQRLLSNLSDAEELERELLGSIQRIDPPAAAKGEAWAKLSAQIGAVALVTTAHGSAAATAAKVASTTASAGTAPLALAPSALKVLGGKLIVGLAVTSAALGASVWVHVRSSQPQPVAPVVTLQALNPRPVLAPPPVPSEPPLAVPPELVPVPENSSKSSIDQRRKDRLSAESALLTRARAELRRGDTAGAQRTLAQLRSQFPKGVLGQEREVLTIEVLSAQGNAEAARTRASAFIAAYPKSPHSAQLSRFADAP